MSLRINFNLAAVQAHQNLAAVDRSLQQNVSNISSGTRLHLAGDDPAAMVLANAMRNHLAGIDQATKNSEEGVSMIQTAEGAMDEISSLLTRIRSLAVEAANDGVQNPASLASLQGELDQAVGSITGIANRTSFGTQSLLDGSFAKNTVSTASSKVIESVVQDATNLPGDIAAGSTITTTVAAPMTLDRSKVQITLTGAVSPLPGSTVLQGLDQNGTILNAVDNQTFTVTGQLGSRTLTIPAGATIDDVVAQVNAFTSQTGARAAYDPATGSLTVESTTFGNGPLAITSQDMSGSGVGLLDSDTTTAANTYAVPGTNQTVTLDYTDAGGTARTVTLTQDPASPGGLTFTNLAGGPELVAPYTAFDPGAFKVTFKDTSGGAFGSTVAVAAGAYTATRTTTAFIQTGALANQTTPFEIPDMRAGALGHTAGLAASGWSDLQSLVSGKALTSGNAQSALKVIDAAIQEVSGTRGNLGAIQADALETSMASLQISFTNLTSAESQLRDTDVAAESAAFTKNNIIYQAATAMLAQANQIPQTVLQMLKNTG
jgi:flagellin